MTQVKLFSEKTFQPEQIEKKINGFLQENEGKIIVKDIKYTSENSGASSNSWRSWTFMVIYEVK
jgi:hypothetical protein